MTSQTPPTATQYSRLQQAYDFFNAELFGGQLPPCLITLQRQKRVMGYFSRRRFVDAEMNFTDEIAMNPEFFGREVVVEVLQTIVHEMCHLWQCHLGKPGRRAYHNQEWADKMESIGLMPSSTGKPGGSITSKRGLEWLWYFRPEFDLLLSRDEWSDQKQASIFLYFRRGLE